jgi:ATP-dependent protease HslVU (ClpYQ) peptidase subunit
MKEKEFNLKEKIEGYTGGVAKDINLIAKFLKNLKRFNSTLTSSKIEEVLVGELLRLSEMKREIDNLSGDF